MIERVKLEKIFDTLPDDEFGVLVLNDSDRRKLIWLVNQIGETKLRRAVNDLANRYPGSKPYVSTLQKRFNRKPPLHVYQEVKVLIHRVYVLVVADNSKLKVGFSGDWIIRMSNLPNDANDPLKLYDLDKSFSVLTPGHVQEARPLEKALLIHLIGKGYQTDPPPDFERFSGSGKREWFVGDAYVEAKRFLEIDATGHKRSIMTLRDALKHDLFQIEVGGSMH